MMEFFENMRFGFSKTCFREDPFGRLSYRPWGHQGRGFLIERPAQERALRRRIGMINALMMFVLLPLLVLCSFIMDPLLPFIVFVVAMLLIWFYMRQLSQGLTPLDD